MIWNLNYNKCKIQNWIISEMGMTIWYLFGFVKFVCDNNECIYQVMSGIEKMFESLKVLHKTQKINVSKREWIIGYSST